MKLRVIALALPLLLGSSVTLASHMMTASSKHAVISFQKVLDVVEKAGYQNVHKIELEHSYYEVEALDAQGKEIKFKVDAMTGKILPMKQPKHKHHQVKSTAKTHD